MRGTPSEILELQAGDLPRVVDVFAEAFRDYPVMNYVIGDGDHPAARLRSLIRFFVSARSLRGEPLLGIARSDRLVAAATVSFPADASDPPALAAVREATWRELGNEARARYAACGAVWKTFTAPDPHVHLNMIGVRPGFQGQGHARRLLEFVQDLSRRTPGSAGVSLSTEDPGNVAFYRRMGYEIIGHGRVPGGPETWGFFRRA